VSGAAARPRRDPLTIDRLRMLRELDRAGTIAGAARHLGLTSSAVSQQLSALEREAGIALVDRAGREATLTSAGHALLPHADAVLATLEAASADLDRIRGIVAGPFRVATVPSAAGALVSPAVTLLRTTHPDLDVTVIDEEPHRSLVHLDRGLVDLAVVDAYDAVPLTLPPGLASVTLLSEPLVAVLPTRRSRSGARSARRSVTLADLADEAWIVAPAEVACGAAVRAACRAAGFEPRVRWQTDDLLLHLDHVAAGHGVAVLPRLAVRPGLAAVEAVPLLGPGLSRRLLAVTRATAVDRPAVAAVRHQLLAACEESMSG